MMIAWLTEKKNIHVREYMKVGEFARALGLSDCTTTAKEPSTRTKDSRRTTPVYKKRQRYD